MRTVSTSPHIHSGVSTKKIMLSVALALAPAAIWGVHVFGTRALVTMCLSIGFALLTEALLNKVSHEDTLWDGSALVTGMLVGMNMPPEVPYFIPVLASVFAIGVVKWTFGGLGHNWANPAIGGRVFVFFSFSSAMSRFSMPRTLLKTLGGVVPDAISGASPLSITKTVTAAKTMVGMTSTEILSSQGYPYTDFAARLSASTGMNPYNIDAFFGNIPGSIGEVSAFLLILGGVYLLYKKIITWYIPASYLASFALLTWIFGGVPNGLGLFHGEVAASMLRGGLILGALFMATDMVTTPYTRTGHFIFGIGCGLFTFLFRTFGSLPEACSVAILMMNIATPTIDRYSVPKRFGDGELRRMEKIQRQEDARKETSLAGSSKNPGKEAAK